MNQILLVEDDRATRARLEQSLRDAGWSSVTATTGRQAIELFARHQPRLAVVSIEMKWGVGAETISRLRWLRSDAAILAVSRGPVTSDLVKTALACGAHHVVIGPVVAEKLGAAVRAALEKPR